MEAVIIPAKTVVHIGGIPVTLATDTIVETSHGNMSSLTGYHYACLGDVPAATPERFRQEVEAGLWHVNVELGEPKPKGNA